VKENEVEHLTTEDFAPKVVWFDKGTTLARLTVIPRLEGDWVGELPRPMAMLTSAHRKAGHIAIVADTFAGRLNQNGKLAKHDGSKWEHGEMEKAARNNTVDADLVYEMLSIFVGSHDGAFYQVSIPYERHGTDPITYGEEQVIGTEDGAQVSGRIPDLFKTAFGQPKMADAMEEIFGGLIDAFELSEDQKDAHSLAMAVKMVMAQYKWVCMVGASTREEEELLRRSFEEGPLSEDIRVLDHEAVDEIVHLQEAWDLPDHVKET
jgi:hypothetical protein